MDITTILKTFLFFGPIFAYLLDFDYYFCFPSISYIASFNATMLVPCSQAFLTFNVVLVVSLYVCVLLVGCLGALKKFWENGNSQRRKRCRGEDNRRHEEMQG